MTLIEQLELTRGALEAWAKTWKAKAVVAADRADVLARILEAPESPHCYVYFEGEEPRGENSDDSGMYDHVLLVVITRGRGLTIDQASGLVKSTPAKAAMLELCEKCRQILRALNFTPTQPEYAEDRDQILPSYKGLRPWRGSGDWPLDAFELEIRILTQILPDAEEEQPS
jgi:hypothetical protein